MKLSSSEIQATIEALPEYHYMCNAIKAVSGDEALGNFHEILIAAHRPDEVKTYQDDLPDYRRMLALGGGRIRRILAAHMDLGEDAAADVNSAFGYMEFHGPDLEDAYRLGFMMALLGVSRCEEGEV